MRLVRPRRNSCARPRIPPAPRVVPHLGLGWSGRPDRLCRFLVVAGASHAEPARRIDRDAMRDRKSTRLNSSHGYISYAVFCLKKKKYSTDHCDKSVEGRGLTTVAAS